MVWMDRGEGEHLGVQATLRGKWAKSKLSNQSVGTPLTTVVKEQGVDADDHINNQQWQVQ